MSSAGVTIREKDLSTRVPSFPGVYGAISLPGAARGPVGVATLVTNQSQLLDRYTPNGKVEVGYDLAYYDAIAYLQGSDKLWVTRTATNSLYGGITVVASDATGEAAAFAAGEADPLAHVFAADDLFILYGKDQGDWNSSLSVTVEDYSSTEPNSFLITVLMGGLVVETHVCSRTPGAQDGFGRNIYLEDVLESSNYVSALDNTAELPSVQPKAIATALAFVGGDDGDAVVDADIILDMEKLKNESSYPLTLLIDGGRATAAYALALIGIAEARKDCVAILSVPYADEANATYIDAITTYRGTTLNANTSYAAIYSAHVLIYDKFNDRKIYVPPTGYVGAIISKTAANEEIWYPAAGFRRGILKVLDVRRRYTKGEMDILYDMQVNPIRFAPGRGILVWGQKTLTARPSSLQHLNVRLLLITIEPAIAEALEDYVFQLNDATERLLVTAMIESYMDGIKARRGVYDFEVVCNSDNNTTEDEDANRMNVEVYVKPTQAIEYIPFTTVITPSGIDFKLAQQAV